MHRTVDHKAHMHNLKIVKFKTDLMSLLPQISTENVGLTAPLEMLKVYFIIIEEIKQVFWGGKNIRTNSRSTVNQLEKKRGGGNAKYTL